LSTLGKQRRTNLKNSPWAQQPEFDLHGLGDVATEAQKDFSCGAGKEGIRSADT
jgi:hypothetical protein